MKQFVFDWHDVGILGRTDKATFQVILESTGRILVNVTQNHILDKSYIGIIAPDGTKLQHRVTGEIAGQALAFIPDGCAECEDVPDVVTEPGPETSFPPGPATPEPEKPPVPDPEPPCADCGDYVVTVPCGTKRIVINLC